MIDEKHDRAISGYQGSGSGFICVLCHATHNSCKHQLGTFKIECNLEETHKLANYVKLNPDNLTDAALRQGFYTLGNLAISLCDTNEKLIDATHADINLGIFFQKLLIRLVADIEQWDATSDVVSLLKDALHKFDMHMKHFIGINPGNYV